MASGKKYRLVPAVPFVVTDTKEAWIMKGCYASAGAQFPCHICQIPKVEIPTCRLPDPVPYRVEHTVDTLIERYLGYTTGPSGAPQPIGRRRDARAKTARRLRDALRGMSIHPRRNPWRLCPYGHMGDMGRFGLSWGEMMHMYEGGLMKYECLYILHSVAVEAKEMAGVTIESQLAKLDSRVQAISFTRQSHRDSSVPLKNFRMGVSDLAKLKSQEYPALTLALMVAIGVEDAFLVGETGPTPVDTTTVQDALSLCLFTWSVLKRIEFYEEHLPTLQRLVER